MNKQPLAKACMLVVFISMQMSIHAVWCWATAPLWLLSAWTAPLASTLWGLGRLDPIICKAISWLIDAGF